MTSELGGCVVSTGPTDEGETDEGAIGEGATGDRAAGSVIRAGGNGDGVA